MIRILNRIKTYRETYDTGISNWTLGLSATGPLSTAVRDHFQDLFQVPLLNTYGTTEQLFISSEIRTQAEVTCGTPLEGVDVEVQGVDSWGSIRVRSDTTATYIAEWVEGAYVTTHDRSVSTTLETGDWGTVAKGVIQIEGRTDGILVIGGLNVSVRMIEELVSTLLRPADICCFPFLDGHDELQLGLAIETSCEESEEVLKGQVRQYLLKRLPAQAIPQVVMKLSKFPVTTTGKTDRQTLRNLAERSLSSDV